VTSLSRCNREDKGQVSWLLVAGYILACFCNVEFEIIFAPLFGEMPERSPVGIPSGERGGLENIEIVILERCQSGLPWGSLRENGAVSLKMKYFTYILKSQSHGNYYYGSCKDLEKRFKEHNGGQVKYTKGRRPWVIHYFEKFETRSEAQKREYFFKSIDGYKYLKHSGII
jgi:putative endonuclease